MSDGFNLGQLRLLIAMTRDMPAETAVMTHSGDGEFITLRREDFDLTMSIPPQTEPQPGVV